MKLLTGVQHGYTMARLAGVQHEVFVAKTGQIPPTENVTQYGDGSIIEIIAEEVIDNETIYTTTYGLLLDETSEYYTYLPEIHKNRVTDYIVDDPIEE